MMIPKLKTLRFSLVEIMMVVAIIGILSSLTVTAHAQVSPSSQTVLTTSTNSVAGSGTATVTSQAFFPNSQTGFSVVPVLSATSAGNATLNFQASLDGTNWTTTYPFTAVIAFTSGTTTAFYNFTPALSGTGPANIPYIRLGQVINSGTSALTIGSITISKSNR